MFLQKRFQPTALHQCTEVCFASFLSGGFTTKEVINPPESELAKRTSVQWLHRGYFARRIEIRLVIFRLFFYRNLLCSSGKSLHFNAKEKEKRKKNRSLCINLHF